MSPGIKRSRKKTMLFLLVVVALSFSAAKAGAITLASGGSTSYSIVSDIGSSNEVDLAVSELKSPLDTSTGATFPSVDVSVSGALTYHIIVGDNTLSRSIVGGATIDALEAEESLIKVSGNNLYSLVGTRMGGVLCK